MADNNPAPRSTLATVLATAAVTLALGVTAAALGGYLTPNRQTQEEPQAALAAATADPSPSVVLVPVSPEPQGVPIAEPEPETRMAVLGHHHDERPRWRPER